MNCWIWSVEWLTTPSLARGVPGGPSSAGSSAKGHRGVFWSDPGEGATQGLPEWGAQR